MALEYYASIDLNKNELQNAVVHPLGSAPTSPAEGQIYYDSSTGDKKIYLYNGSAWVAIGETQNFIAGEGVDVSVVGENVTNVHFNKSSKIITSLLLFLIIFINSS